MAAAASRCVACVLALHFQVRHAMQEAAAMQAKIRSQTHPEVMERTADFHHEMAQLAQVEDGLRQKPTE
jgi:C4-dicarboxylate-specific signal transduction histidine kinase